MILIPVVKCGEWSPHMYMLYSTEPNIVTSFSAIHQQQSLNLTDVCGSLSLLDFVSVPDYPRTELGMVPHTWDITLSPPSPRSPPSPPSPSYPSYPSFTFSVLASFIYHPALGIPGPCSCAGLTAPSAVALYFSNTRHLGSNGRFGGVS